MLVCCMQNQVYALCLMFFSAAIPAPLGGEFTPGFSNRCDKVETDFDVSGGQEGGIYL